MKQCEHCGHEWPDDALFCAKDGRKLVAKAGGEAKAAPEPKAQAAAERKPAAASAPDERPPAAGKPSWVGRLVGPTKRKRKKQAGGMSGFLDDVAARPREEQPLPAGSRSAGRQANKAFSDTLWFLEGDDPESAEELGDGAVDREEGRYHKNHDLPTDVRSRYTLDTQESEPISVP